MVPPSKQQLLFVVSLDQAASGGGWGAFVYLYSSEIALPFAQVLGNSISVLLQLLLILGEWGEGKAKRWETGLLLTFFCGVWGI